jgi:uncharacterized protein YceK
MKLLFTVLVVVCLVGCNSDVEVERNKKGLPVQQYSFELIRVGACQYVVAEGYYRAAIVHAGDCDNSIHNIK